MAGRKSFLRFALATDIERLTKDGVVRGPEPARETWNQRIIKWLSEQRAARRLALVAEDPSGLLGMVQLVLQFPAGYEDPEDANGYDIAVMEGLRIRTDAPPEVGGELVGALRQARVSGFEEFRIMAEPNKLARLLSQIHRMRRNFALLVSMALATTSLGGCAIVNSTIARAVVIAQCDGGADAGYKSVIAACTIILNSNYATDAMRFAAFLHRGEAHAGQREFAQAERDLDFALALDPKDEQVLHALSGVQLFEGNRKGALASASLALHHHPTAENFAARGEVYDYVKEYDPAIADFTRAIALVPKSAEAYNDRCWSRAKSGKQLDLALADCNQALQISPGSPAILNSRGYVFYRLGQYPSAIADLTASMADTPDFASSLYIRGLVERRIDDEPDAAKDMKKATALNPAVATSVVP